MILAILGAYKWAVANWKLILMAAVVASSFWGGWFVRSAIAEAAQNKAIAQAVEKTKAEMEKDYDKAKRIESYKAEQRKKARENRAKLAQDFDNHPDYSKCIVPDSGVFIRNQAIGN